eukprot:Nk52_evm19s2612 gene=Nk52_evmTU19s2612
MSSFFGRSGVGREDLAKVVPIGGVADIANASTDPGLWRLGVCEGRQWWEYNPGKGFNGGENGKVEEYFMKERDTQHTEAAPLTRPGEEGGYKIAEIANAAHKGMHFFADIQTADGHWTCDYGGPMFLLPGLVISCYVTGTGLSMAEQIEMVRYLCSQQKKKPARIPEGENSDTVVYGGWGLHIEDRSTMFGTVLNYVALRLLGLPPTHEVCVLARECIAAMGGATAIPQWGKFWLAVLGVYEWKGINPIPPELWLLPEWVPVHPSLMWCHCRQVYLPMGYCYGHRVTGKITPLVEALREEVYVGGPKYGNINWESVRDKCCEVDLYHPHSWLLNVGNVALNLYENYLSGFCSSWRDRSLKMCFEHIRQEDENTKYTGIGPVSKVINMLAWWHAEGSQCVGLQKHQEKISDFLFMKHDGMRMQGTNGVQLWDTAFAVRAFLEVPSIYEGALSSSVDKAKIEKSLASARDFILLTQIPENVPERERFYREVNKGGFPFSTRDCGWIVSDCTAEGLKAMLELRKAGLMADDKSDESMRNRYFDAVDVLLRLRNSDGGFASYERKRGGWWLEKLNPSEVFGDIMIDYTYVECTSAVMQSLQAFHKQFPEHRADEIAEVVDEGCYYIRSKQRGDGSFEGSWGVCFTYGGWFGIEGLVCAGERFDLGTASGALERACDFLVEKQRLDGGWGESFKSCVERRYIDAESHPVNTAWVLLALIAARYPDRRPIERGIEFLVKSQLANGDWEEGSIVGVFNKNCMISYPNYKNLFPIWALGRYMSVYKEALPA